VAPTVGVQFLPGFKNEPACTEGNYSLAELRRIYLAPQGELTEDEYVVLGALLEFIPSAAFAVSQARTEAEQAVLDAMGRIPGQRLEWEAKQGSSPAKAELARRGLKP
jgi:hypothetical protein